MDDKPAYVPASGVTIPLGWFVAIVVGMFSVVASAAWYMSDQAAEIKTLKANVIRYETEAAISRKTFDASLEAMRTVTNTLNDRLTRTESQLLYVTDTIRTSSRR